VKRLIGLVTAAALIPGLAGCGSDSSGPGTEGATITVFAAASLTATFTELGELFESEHEGVTVDLSFAGSSDLVAQIQEGAPADVFASADEASMARLTAAGLEGSDPALFAANTLEIAVPPDNPAGIASFEDLARDGLALVLCAPEVPCGAASVAVADAAGLTLEPVSEEQSVTDVLGKVRSGEADAGLVYVTDVAAAGDAVMGIEFPESADAVNLYPIATVADSAEPDLAQEFVDLVLSPTGQQVLRDACFQAAP
jgi:molybdate transport system substrate-binding protein